MADIVIRAKAVQNTPNGYTVPGAQEILVKSVKAEVNGTGAAAAFLPTLQLIAPDGSVVWQAPTDASVAAGGSASVSWFPRVGGAGSAASISVVGARIENHAGQSVATTTNTDLTYDTVAFDTNGMANLGADARKLTVQTAGLYLVMCTTGWAYNSAGRRVNLVTYNNFYSVSAASAVAGGTSPAIWASPVGGSGGAPRTATVAVTTVKAAAGDFFASGGNQDSGSTVVANGLASGSNQDNFLAAILLGAA